MSNINSNNLASLFYDSMIEKVPLKEKIKSQIQTRNLIPFSNSSNRKQLSSKKSKINNSSIKSNTNHSKTNSPSNLKIKSYSDNSNKYNLIYSQDDYNKLTSSLYKDQIELNNKINFLKNRINLLSSQESQYKTQMKNTKKKEDNLKSIILEKDSIKKALSNVKEENENLSQLKRNSAKINKKVINENLRKSSEKKLNQKKNDYNRLLEVKNQVHEMQIAEYLNDEEKKKENCIKQKKKIIVHSIDMNKKLEELRHQSFLINAEKKQTDTLKNQLINLTKQEEILVNRLRNTKKKFYDTFSMEGSNCQVNSKDNANFNLNASVPSIKKKILFDDKTNHKEKQDNPLLSISKSYNSFFGKLARDKKIRIKKNTLSNSMISYYSNRSPFKISDKKDRRNVSFEKWRNSDLDFKNRKEKQITISEQIYEMNKNKLLNKKIKL